MSTKLGFFLGAELMAYVWPFNLESPCIILTSQKLPLSTEIRHKSPTQSVTNPEKPRIILVLRQCNFTQSVILNLVQRVQLNTTVQVLFKHSV